ncbi:hypothetical protein CROQUDRAFT_97945 [Cronartium quercuum f. sp. fusiforme G11]|uniref:Uncharacterized protein n=1 Tax=Cronartium quercuum f. sp. fusiforme G11 TaxID=708437 RepID=A0A9P6N9H9_9BASI|nr:hypothetical protein CROQUDRAFT_97945 [Cronartium quercuum f. sp. fusiforme G11]
MHIWLVCITASKNYSDKASEHTEMTKSRSTTVRDQLGLHCPRTPRTALSE